LRLAAALLDCFCCGLTAEAHQALVQHHGNKANAIVHVIVRVNRGVACFEIEM
jgi:hypothetical protein